MNISFMKNSLCPGNWYVVIEGKISGGINSTLQDTYHAISSPDSPIQFNSYHNSAKRAKKHVSKLAK